MAVPLAAASGLTMLLPRAPPVLSELLSTKVRFTALSIGYGLAVTIFGGFAPFIATFPIQRTGSQVSPAAFLVFGAIISAATLIAIKDPTNAPLD